MFVTKPRSKYKLVSGKRWRIYHQKKFKSSENYDLTSQERKLEISHSMKTLSMIIRRLIKGKRKEISWHPQDSSGTLKVSFSMQIHQFQLSKSFRETDCHLPVILWASFIEEFSLIQIYFMMMQDLSNSWSETCKIEKWAHKVEITEIYSLTFCAKISWK